MIMATLLLNQRIKDVMCARKAAGKADITPTLVDLERTHILFVNAHFKPFAAIGYEYNKVRPSTGSPTLGNGVTFSIPQFGDFFADMVGHQTIGAVSSSTQTAPTQGVAGFPANGFDWDNTTALAGATYSLVDAFGNPVFDGAGAWNGQNSAGNAAGVFRNLVRYCEYPGERLYTSVKFDVNGNPLDEYNDTIINMIRKFTIGSDKITGYKRLVGQEVALEGESGPRLCVAQDANNNGAQPTTTLTAAANGFPQIPSQSATPLVTPTPNTFLGAAFPDAAWDLSLPANPTAAPFLAVTREAKQAYDGPQTPKYQQPALDIWNKLRFWFNDDVRLAIASVSIPFGQRFITVELAALNQLVYEFPGLFVCQTFDLGAAVAVDGTHTGGTTAVNIANTGTRTKTYRPWNSAGTLTGGTLSNVELYVNNIFVNPEVHDIFINRIGFSLIRVYRFQRTRSNSDTHDEVLLSQLKWPIEYMFVGLRPSFNVSDTNPNQWRDWHRMTKTVDVVCDDYDYAETTAGGAGPNPLADIVSRMGAIYPTRWVKELPTVDIMSVSAHGISLADSFPNKFFNAYNPFNYGSNAIVTPSDEGALMVNFCLFPRSYQPSGHLNVSRAREFYLKWTTRYVTSTTTADLLVAAVAINFLLITDGSAVLRYST